MIQRVNSKLAVPWYPKDWWESGIVLRLKDDPKALMACFNIMLKLYLEGGRAIITKDMAKKWMGWRQLNKSSWSRVCREFTVGVDQKWSIPSVTKRLEKAEMFSESNKKKWASRYQNSELTVNSRKKVDDNPYKGGNELTKEARFPPIEQKTETPEWAKNYKP